MTTPTAESERDRLEQALARLEMKRRALDEALGEFLHEGRRTRDALERAGGYSRPLEARARGLAKNVAQTRKDLEQTDREIEALRQSLGRLAQPGDEAS